MVLILKSVPESSANISDFAVIATKTDFIKLIIPERVG